MYIEEDYKISSRAANSTKAFVESMIKNYEESIRNEESRNQYNKQYSEEALMVMENMNNKHNTLNRYYTFSSSVRSGLVTEALCKLLEASTYYKIKEDKNNRMVMRAIVNEYVHENGYENIMNRLKTASPAMSEMYRVIDNNIHKILESVDKDDPATFVVTPKMKDEFFKSLDYNDTEAIEDAIRSRVSDAMEDFVTANKEDHDNVADALKQAQEKIADVPEEQTELKEYYEMKAKRITNEIRNKPKSVLHSMITSMCESVLKHKDTHSEFIKEGHLDMNKIVDRVSIMYTFMEMLNTARIDRIDTIFIENMINDLKK